MLQILVRRRAVAAILSALQLLVFAGSAARAQQPAGHDTTRAFADTANLDSLLARAVAVGPTLTAAQRRVDAARARVGPAGARPDPTLMAGIQNQPLGREAPTISGHGVATTGGRDPMTMHMIGVTQTLPYPGKLALRTTAAQRDVEVALAALDDTRAQVVHDVRAAYYQVAYLDAALAVVERNRSVLADIVSVTESHYATGAGMQQDILEARLRIARLAQDASALAEQRHAQAAALNALLDRPSDAPIDRAAIPARIARAAVPDSADHIRFTANTFGAPAADSPLPPLADLQAMAIASSPMLREHEAQIAAQTARVAIADKATKPDIDISIEYGQRNGLTDMLSAVVSVPVPVQHGRKQDEEVAAERADLAVLQAEHHAQVNDIRSRVAKLASDLERERTQLALDVKAILPQGRATLAATTASYQAGKTDILALLDAQSALFGIETSYYRTLSDFAESLADLEQVVGKNVPTEARP